MTSLPESSARRRGLLGIKLEALVRDSFGTDAANIEVDVADDFGPGAAASVGSDAWVLLDDGAGPRLGAALAWALRSGAESLHIVASEPDAGTIARRAAAFRYPIEVFTATERTLLPAPAAAAPVDGAVSDAHREFEAMIVDAGAMPIEEFGVLVGEVIGLEVCRVVDDDATGVTRLEVGVGAHDREAFTMVHGDTPTVDSLRRIVDTVKLHRAPDAAPHPLNRLAQERRLRDRLIEDPSLVGASELAAARPPVPRPNLKDAVPAVASGVGMDGRSMVVVCSVGVDLELVPFAADARSALDPGADLTIVTPSRDQLKVTSEMVALLTDPANLVAIDSNLG